MVLLIISFQTRPSGGQTVTAMNFFFPPPILECQLSTPSRRTPSARPHSPLFLWTWRRATYTLWQRRSRGILPWLSRWWVLTVSFAITLFFSVKLSVVCITIPLHSQTKGQSRQHCCKRVIVLNWSVRGFYCQCHDLPSTIPMCVCEHTELVLVTARMLFVMY